jgi:hypothetical protein
MPRGSKPGEGNRGGGRKKGKLNKATIERAALAERITAEAAMSGKKLGKELIEEFAVMFGGLAAAVQPEGTGPNGQVTRPDVLNWIGTKQESAFERYSKLALKAASDLAEYQSPKLVPLHMASPAPESRGPIRKRFTINIFDHQGRPAPRAIRVGPTPATSPASGTDLSRDRGRGDD